MERHPVILSIAGSDCSGGAGIPSMQYHPKLFADKSKR